MRLSKPPEGFLKCNADCTLFQHNSCFGADIWFRDSIGRIVLSQTTLFPFIGTVVESETTVSLVSIQLANDHGFNNVQFMCNNLTVATATNKAIIYNNELSHLISLCRGLFSVHASYNLAFGKRKANMTSHTLARISLFHASRCSIFLQLPECIATLIIEEMQ
uniref:Uncharacterized protein LOC105852906 n=1 Tax=Cicer arietinum TaxID=3827 RepID=A0A1S3EJS1_CICAR|nr:uncharacterized protein LOC105852906 [Cicer arietinum]